jgi:L-alanine-DL-glutamate epimerase-like enolase superfamily enzyme
MPRRVRLLSAELHYEAGIRLHTASSGAVDSLREVYLLIEEADTPVAVGGVRTNIAYLTGMPEPALRTAIIALVSGMDWRRDFQSLLRDLGRAPASVPAAARALVDCTLLDGLARTTGRPLVDYLGGHFANVIPTNQSLFWSSDAELEANVRRYLAAGFRELKLRVGIGTLADDLRRLSQVRALAGPGVKLAIDANGTWSSGEALHHLVALEPFGLAYVEQPVPAGDWGMIARLSAASPVPIMLDESLGSLADAEELARHRAAPLAHLKVVKLGGLTPLLAAARRLAEAGIELMVGQMNEGALATAAAAQAALAVRPRYTELYGAYGLLDDPARGIAYRDGTLILAPDPGLGVALDPSGLTILWEKIL